MTSVLLWIIYAWTKMNFQSNIAEKFEIVRYRCSQHWFGCEYIFMLFNVLEKYRLRTWTLYRVSTTYIEARCDRVVLNINHDNFAKSLHDKRSRKLVQPSSRYLSELVDCSAPTYPFDPGTLWSNAYYNLSRPYIYIRARGIELKSYALCYVIHINSILNIPFSQGTSFPYANVNIRAQ